MPSFISLSSKSLFVAPTLNDIGNYTIVIKLTDKNDFPKSNTYEFKVMILNSEAFEEWYLKNENETNSKSINSHNSLES